jgi:hypothetical protein
MQKETKKCRDCGEVKPIDDFYKKQEGNRFNNCKECFKAQVKSAKKDRHNKTYDHRRIMQHNRGKAKLLAFWQSIPAALKEKDYFQKVKNVKITNEEEDLLPRLLMAKNLSDIADILEVETATIRRWQKTNFVKRHTEKFDSWNNVMRFKKDIDYAFTQKTIIHGDAARVKLWKQLYEGWVEKSANINEYDENNVVSIQKKLRELASKGPEEIKKLSEPHVLKLHLDDTSGNYEESWADDGGLGEVEGDSEDFV